MSSIDIKLVTILFNNNSRDNFDLCLYYIVFSLTIVRWLSCGLMTKQCNHCQDKTALLNLYKLLTYFLIYQKFIWNLKKNLKKSYNKSYYYIIIIIATPDNTLTIDVDISWRLCWSLIMNVKWQRNRLTR